MILATPLRSLLAASLLAAGLAAQCPPATSAVTPFAMPIAAGGFSIQHSGPALQAGQIDYVLIGLPLANPLPWASLPPGLNCTPVGTAPCFYANPALSVAWYNFGPSPGASATVTLPWPNNPVLSGLLIVAQFGTAGCVGPAPDQSVLLTIVLQ